MSQSTKAGIALLAMLTTSTPLYCCWRARKDLKPPDKPKPETEAARSFLNPSTQPGHKHELEAISARPTVPELDGLAILRPPYELPAQDLSSASVTQQPYAASADLPQRDPTPPPRTLPPLPLPSPLALPGAHPPPALLPPLHLARLPLRLSALRTGDVPVSRFC